jgi:hypothetical protein
MTTWTHDELDRIAQADELAITALRDDGEQSAPTTISVVRDGDDLYVRAYGGHDGSCFRTARARHEGRIGAGGVDREVTFVEEADPAVNDRLDQAYRAKYHDHEASHVEPVPTRAARAATLKLVPR